VLGLPKKVDNRTRAYSVCQVCTFPFGARSTWTMDWFAKMLLQRTSSKPEGGTVKHYEALDTPSFPHVSRFANCPIRGQLETRYRT
jgi:hypothetical protein